jgi:hypothetical protein
MSKQILYRANEGNFEVFESAKSAVVDGRYDATNWGHDWVLISAVSETQARKIARAYDAGLNTDRLKAPKYLKPIGIYFVGMRTANRSGVPA